MATKKGDRVVAQRDLRLRLAGMYGGGTTLVRKGVAGTVADVLSENDLLVEWDLTETEDPISAKHQHRPIASPAVACAPEATVRQ